MGRGPKWSKEQLEDATRLFEAGVEPLDMLNLRPHWPLPTVKKLHVKHNRDMPFVRAVTTAVAQSWSEDARASLAAFLDENPEPSIADVAKHLRDEYGLVCHRTTVWRAIKQLLIPFKRLQSSQAESLQGVVVALEVNLVHGFSPVYIVRVHCKVSLCRVPGDLAQPFRTVLFVEDKPGLRVAARQRPNEPQ